MQIAKKKLDKKPNMDCVNLVTTILACYPQISTLSVDANETIHLHYILNKVLNNKKIDELKKHYSKVYRHINICKNSQLISMI